MDMDSKFQFQKMSIKNLGYLYLKTGKIKSVWYWNQLPVLLRK